MSAVPLNNISRPTALEPHVQNAVCNNRLLHGGIRTILSAGAGAFCGHLYMGINPLAGAFFAGSHQLIHEVIDYAMEKIGWNSRGSLIIEVAKLATSTFISLGAVLLITNAVGLPITLVAVLTLISGNVFMQDMYKRVQEGLALLNNKEFLTSFNEEAIR